MKLDDQLVANEEVSTEESAKKAKLEINDSLLVEAAKKVEAPFDFSKDNIEEDNIEEDLNGSIENGNGSSNDDDISIDEGNMGYMPEECMTLKITDEEEDFGKEKGKTKKIFFSILFKT